MTFNDIWSQLCAKRPKLNDPDAAVEIKVSQFKALLRQVYEQGEAANKPSSPDVLNPFKDLFGGKGPFG